MALTEAELMAREAQIEAREHALREAGKDLLLRERALRQRERLLDERESRLQEAVAREPRATQVAPAGQTDVATPRGSDGAWALAQKAVDSDPESIDVHADELREASASFPVPAQEGEVLGAAGQARQAGEELSAGERDVEVSGRVESVRAHDAQTGDVDVATGLRASSPPAVESSSGEAEVLLPAVGMLDGSVHGGVVRLRLRLPENFVGRSVMPDVAIHFFVAAQQPVFLLRVTCSTTDGAEPTLHEAVRALSSRNYRDRLILDALRKKFRAEITHGVTETDAHTVVVEKRMESNMLRGLDRSARLPVSPDPNFDLAASQAIEALAALPALPHFLNGQALGSKVVDCQIALLSALPYAEPDALEPILLQHGIAENLVLLRLRELITRAADEGLALPPAFLSRALEYGRGASRADLAADLLRAFCRRAEDIGETGLTEDAVADNFAGLLDVAIAVGGDLDKDAVRIAFAHLQLPPGDIAKWPEQSLRLAVLDQGMRVAAFNALVQRVATDEGGDLADPHARALATIDYAMSKADRTDIVWMAPAFARLGERGVEVLLGLLDADRAHVRQAAAFILAKQRVRRALVALITLLLGETTDIWKEVARAIAEFGVASVRPLCRAVADKKNPRNRVAYALTVVQLLHPESKEGIEVEAQEADPALLVALKGAQSFVMEDLRLVTDAVETGRVQALDDAQALGVALERAAREKSRAESAPA